MSSQLSNSVASSPAIDLPHEPEGSFIPEQSIGARLRIFFSKAINRYLHLIHRWFGIGIGLFVLLWFLSGVVMMYVAYPELTETERYQALTTINKDLIKLTAEEAWHKTNASGVPEQIRLSNDINRPAYYFLQKKKWYPVWADTGEFRKSISEAEAIASAQSFIKNTNPVKEITLIKLDQWSLSSGLNSHRPLYRINTDDKANSMLYVSSRTGEVVRDTTAWERGWNWVGSVIHWIYFTPLRIYQEPWRQTVMWSSGAAFLLAITGLWLGIQRMRLKKRYSGNRITPYRGWKKWHHLSGLIGAVFAITWIFSGWLSVNPFNFFASNGLTDQEQKVYSGSEFYPSLLKANAAKALGSSFGIVEIKWRQIGESSFLVMHSSSDSKIIDTNKIQTPLNQLPEAFLIERVSAMKPDVPVKATTTLTEGDLYYYSHHRARPLPVIRVDFADDVETSVYVNLATGKIEASEINSSRVYRWLYNGLHSLDFSPLLVRRPLWDIVVIVLLIVGSALSVTGMYLAIKRIKR